MNRTGTPWTSPLFAALIAILLIAPASTRAADQAAESADAIARIMETFARPAVDRGAAVGIAVGVTFRGRPPQFFSYGIATVADRTVVAPDTIFEMGSVTKSFTTALLGDAVLAGRLKLNLPLSRLETLLGTMKPSTRAVTLMNLGDFTAGFPSTPPVCPTPTPPLPPGCTPNFRPTITEYGAQDLLDYFRSVSAPRMPGPYFYSDISTGLIGLILGSNPNAPMGDDAVAGWLDLLHERIVGPLRMTDTFLYDQDASPSQRARLAGGYSTPSVTATASNGGLVISGFNGGYNYSSAPAATVIGGGGSGATVETAIDDTGTIVSIEVTNSGQGYVAPAQVIFGGDPTTPAQARAIVSNGQVIGITVLYGGAGYSPKHPPTVTLVGGTSGPDARPAVLAPATVSNGGVDFVRVIDGGASYVSPIAVIVTPGNPNVNAVPIWAPAGALKSSTRDMMSFAEAALGHAEVNGVQVDSRLRSAFRLAQRGYVCEFGDQRPCILLAGLAWTRNPASGGMPAVVAKNGGLNGFTTNIRLVPSLDLGVVVFANTDQTQGIEQNGNPQPGAELVADNIMYAIARSNLR